jgi:ABC-type nitrate/sulfonate/bicarbonate transport system permease component
MSSAGHAPSVAGGGHGELSPDGKGSGPTRLANALVFVLSIASALAFWELLSRTGAISERDLPSMSSAVGELSSMAQTAHFWSAFGYTVRGWAVGLALASVLAIPLGVVLGLSDLGARAFRVPIEFLRPIPSAALIPLLFLTLGTNFKSEVFLATFGAFWPILVQTMYGVRDIDPVTSDTARSFGVPPTERLRRITLPSSVPYILTGMRIASSVALILAFTAELFMGTPGLGRELNYAQSYGLTTQLYALALATGILGLATHLAFTAFEHRMLRWHPSQRVEAL